MADDQSESVSARHAVLEFDVVLAAWLDSLSSAAQPAVVGRVPGSVGYSRLVGRLSLSDSTTASSHDSWLADSFYYRSDSALVTTASAPAATPPFPFGCPSWLLVALVGAIFFFTIRRLSKNL